MLITAGLRIGSYMKSKTQSHDFILVKNLIILNFFDQVIDSFVLVKKQTIIVLKTKPVKTQSH